MKTRGNIGGLIGDALWQMIPIRIIDCYATGNIDVNINNIIYRPAFLGGLAGDVGGDVSITNCYAAGAVNCRQGSGSVIGGVAGRNNAAVFNCYFLKTASVSNGIGQGIDDGNTPGLTDDQMRRRNSFPGFFNASTLWEIQEGKSYPYLRGVGTYIPVTNEELPVINSATALLSVAVASGALHLDGLTVGDRIAIYTVGGQCVYETRAADRRQTVVAPPGGVYIVTSGGRSAKIVVP